MTQLTDQEMEMVRHAEARIYNAAAGDGSVLGGFVATAIIVELKSMLLIGKSFRNLEILEKVFDIRK